MVPNKYASCDFLSEFLRFFLISNMVRLKDGDLFRELIFYQLSVYNLINLEESSRERNIYNSLITDYEIGVWQKFVIEKLIPELPVYRLPTNSPQYVKIPEIFHYKNPNEICRLLHLFFDRLIAAIHDESYELFQDKKANEQVWKEKLVFYNGFGPRAQLEIFN